MKKRTIQERIKNLEAKIRRMRVLTETRWGFDALTILLSLVEIIKELAKEVEKKK